MNDEATELKLYIDNDGDLYRQQTTSILKNLATKKARDEYKHDLAVKAFGYLVESGAKKYDREHGSPGTAWHQVFNATTRKQVAEALAKEFEAEEALGNYDSLLPKKYQEIMAMRTKPKQFDESHAKRIAARIKKPQKKTSAQLEREIASCMANYKPGRKKR